MSRTVLSPAVEPPTMAFFLAFLGGVLVAVEGLVLLGGGAEPITVIGGTSGSELPSFGGVGVAAGIAAVGVGFSLLENPRHRVTVGVALIGLGAVSLVAGGGFLAGAGLSLAGGLLAALRGPQPLRPVH